MVGSARGHFKVFIGHDTRDADVAHRLFNILDRLGGAAPYIYEVYPNYRRDIPTAIIEVVRNCKLCICLLSRHGIESQWVHQELGAAFASGKIILTCVEAGVDYKGFVQFHTKIPYDPMSFDDFAYSVIYGVRDTLLGHDPIPLRLTCPERHETRFICPSTKEVNDAIANNENFLFECPNCATSISVSPLTLEEVGGA